MAGSGVRWEFGLDQPGSAESRTLRRAVAFSAAIVATAIAVVLLGDIQLEAFPQFATFHAGFVFLVDAITSVVLFGQFRYRRVPFYAILAGAYLFNAFVMVPFLLSFPGALKAGESIIGGRQSSIWVWHLWHILFPALVAFALVLHARIGGRLVPAPRVAGIAMGALFGALGLALGVTAAVTEFHDQLPTLIDGARMPMTASFYVVGGIAAAVTAAAMLLAWRLGWQQRTILHLWLATALTALLADVAASLGAHARYTVGWYFGRVESMAAAAVLLVVFLGELSTLYDRLAATMRDLFAANDQLARLVVEKDALVAELRESEERVRQLAYYDPLTELPNRRMLLDRIDQALARAKRHRYSMAIMFLDLDRFKQINDTLGHEVGDDLLKQVAARLSLCVRAGDTVSRSGGDEFVIVLTEISHPQDAAIVAQKMIQAIGAPIAIGSHALQVTTSVGIALYPIDGEDDMRELMRKADTAMYAAKEAGRNRYRFYGDRTESAPEKE